MRRRQLLVLAAAAVAVLAALAPAGRAPGPVAASTANLCAPRPGDPANADYNSAERGVQGKTWNDEQWYLYSCMPRSAPLATDPENASGMSVDAAWRAFGSGRDDVVVAYMEGGVNWRISQSAALRLRAFLNRRELPYPEDAQGRTKPMLAAQGRQFHDSDPYDLNDDGVFNVDDYKDDPRIARPFLHQGTAGGITTEDLIAAFGHCQIQNGAVLQCPPGGHFDNDGNGYANDISGWNFQYDTNDPQTENSIYGHSDGESTQVVGDANGPQSTVGICPRCRLLEVKAGHEAIDRPDRIAEAITFAVDSGARVIAGVIASTGLTAEVRAALDYAYRHNVVVVWASNDFDSADHTDGMFYPRVWPGNSITGDQSTRGQQSPSVLANRTFRSRSTLTSYGPHALFATPNNDGSTSTGTPTQAGVAALVVSEGLTAAEQGLINGPLSADEARQVVRATASNIDDPTLSFPGLPGATFNIFYGYGRPNLLKAMQAVHDNRIPPSVDILAPDWYSEVDPTRTSALHVVADVAARRSPGEYTYEVQYGIGPQPLESDFQTFASGTGSSPQRITADLDLSRIPPSFWSGQYQITADRLSIERYDVTIRVRVHDSRQLMGEDRRAFHLRHDDTEQPGYPVRTGSSGESSPTMADIEGRGFLDTVLATADGRVHAFRPDGTEAPGFPVHSGPAPGMDPASDVNYLGAPAWRDGTQPRPRDGVASVTAVGDLRHDGAEEIVAATMSGRVYVWDGAGRLVSGFPVETDRAFTHEPVPVPNTPYTRARSTGSFASPVLVDLERAGQLDIVLAAWDGRVYAWRPDGTAVPGWPVETENPNKPSGGTYARDYKVVSTPAVADVDGDGVPDIIVPLQDTSWPNNPASAPISAYLEAIHGQGNRYPGGAIVHGWPIALQGLVQGYGTAQDFVTEGVTSPLVFDLPTGPAVMINVNLLTHPYVVDLHSLKVRPLSIAPSIHGGALVGFTTSPSAGRLLGTPWPQVAMAGSAGLDIVAGVVELPGAGVKVDNGISAWDPATGATLPQIDQYIQGLGFVTAPAIADVGGGDQAIIETADSGALMAFDGRTGQPAPGFPKWTGGFGLYTPAIGDVDGSGVVEVAAQTREGYLHMWRTQGMASANNQAWHWHQDDRNTGHYGTDTRPPAAVHDLSWTAAGDVDTLTFTAPGDDWNSGTAARYEVFRSAQEITQATLASATAVPVSVQPHTAGARETIQVPHVAGQGFYAVRAVDAAGNIGPVRVLSETAEAALQPHGGTPSVQAIPNTSAPAWRGDAVIASLAVLSTCVATVRRRRRGGAR